MSELSKLNHSRLVVRTKYYRDKTLNLEKKLQQAENEIQHLLEKIQRLKNENTIVNEENNDLKTMVDKNKLEKLQRENFLLLKKLEEIATEKEDHFAKVNQRIEEYESLLSDIQKEFTEKEMELEYYKSKVKSLEKQSRVYMNTSQAQSRKPVANAKSTLCYFDYSIVKKSDQEFIFIGDFHIHNFGSEPLLNPTVCFRFSPPELAALKGKIFTFEQATLNKPLDAQWMFLNSDWAQEAKEKGEIWLVSTEPIHLQQGESTTVHRFQIPVTFSHPGTLIIEGFVYSESNQKMKSNNNIIFTYH